MSQRVTEQVCGITEFRTPTSRIFTGTIKKTPEDFIVVELDPLGNALNDVQYALPLDVEEHQTVKGGECQNKSLGLPLVGGGDSSGSSVKPPEAIRSPDVLLNEETRARLDVLAEKVKQMLHGKTQNKFEEDTANSACGSSESAAKDCEENCEFSLGVYPLKEERRLLHNWVGWLYPILHIRSGSTGGSKTNNKNNNINSNSNDPSLPRSSPDNPNELIVTANPDYSFFFRVLGEKAADCIVRSSVHGIQAGDWSRSDNTSADSPYPSCSTPSRFKVPSDAQSSLCASFSEDSSKDDRRAMHDKLRAKYHRVQCRVKDGVVQLTIKPQSRPAKTDTNSHDRNQRERIQKSSAGGADVGGASESPVYTHLVVKKRDIDLFDLYDALSGFFEVPRTAVCIAGIKDKCAVTWQRCSVPGDHTRMLRRLAEKQTSTSVPNSPTAGVVSVSAGSVWIVAHRVLKKPICVGDLSGNRFCITLRNLRVCLANSATPEPSLGPVVELLRERLSDVQKNGFLNYFGTQRFGMVTSTEMHTGVHVVAGRWSAAVRSLLAHADPEVYNGLPHSLRSVQNAPEKRRRSDDDRVDSLPNSGVGSNEASNLRIDGNNRMELHEGETHLSPSYSYSSCAIEQGEGVEERDADAGLDACGDTERDQMQPSSPPQQQQHQQRDQRSGKGGKDASLVFHTLRMAYLRCSSRDALTQNDVKQGTEVWETLCHEALLRVPFSLRALWVHAAQSVVFNQLLSAVARSTKDEEEEEGGVNGEAKSCISRIPPFLPLLGYRVSLMGNGGETALKQGGEGEREGEVLESVGEEKSRNEVQFSPNDLHFLQEQLRGVLSGLQLRHEDFTSTAKVLGVPLRGSWRRCVVHPENATLERRPTHAAATGAENKKNQNEEREEEEAEAEEGGGGGSIASVQFSLPPSSYATVFLRELLGEK